jgi:hypothetical protein
VEPRALSSHAPCTWVFRAILKSAPATCTVDRVGAGLA